MPHSAAPPPPLLRRAGTAAGPSFSAAAGKLSVTRPSAACSGAVSAGATVGGSGRACATAALHTNS
eukprot:358949-Chlamydomonas_euryale.AAC.8